MSDAKWYEVLIEDRFMEYFSNKENKFYHLDEEGLPVLEPMFLQYKQIISGITHAWNCNAYSNEGLQVNMDREKECMKKAPADISYGFLCCMNRGMEKGVRLTDYWQSIAYDPGESPYSVDVELLSCEQTAILIIYPFCSRMGGSFETYFLDDGRLLKYMNALKRKVEEKRTVETKNVSE